MDPPRNLPSMIGYCRPRYSRARYCNHLRNVYLTFTRGRAPLNVHAAPYFFAIPTECSGIFHTPPGPRSKIQDSLKTPWEILDPGPSRILPNIANMLYLAGSKIQDSPRFKDSSRNLGSWIQPNIEYWAIFGRLLYIKFRKNCLKSRGESWIQPSIKCKPIKLNSTILSHIMCRFNTCKQNVATTRHQTMHQAQNYSNHLQICYVLRICMPLRAVCQQ